MALTTYDMSVIRQPSLADNPLMAFHVADTPQHSLDEPIGMITADELDEARRDPEVIAVLDEADRFLAQLVRQGRTL
ncbi:MAG: hypothetical protein M3Y09_18565 [Actinomycetota bacterium]|nr:hypothetical protein [Actinomycetota bacterium]